MSALNVISLVILGLIFLLWVISVTRILTRLTRGAGDWMLDFGDGFGAWFRRTLAAYGEILTAPEYRADRRRLLVLTVLLFAVIFARVILLT